MLRPEQQVRREEENENMVMAHTKSTAPDPTLLVPRYEKDVNGVWKSNVLPQNNPTFVALGTFILYVGWFGFNGGSLIVMLSRDAAGTGLVNNVAPFGRVFINTGEDMLLDSASCFNSKCFCLNSSCSRGRSNGVSFLRKMGKKK